MSRTCSPNLAGRLRHRVTIQKPTETRNDYGEPEKSYSDVARIRASVEPLQGQERANAQQVNSARTHKVIIRYRSDITFEWRVVFGDRTFNIASVIDPMERNHWLELECEEVF